MKSAWKGFEFTPEGSLIDQIIVQSTKIGVAYERCLDYYKKFHSHDQLILVFPRPSCQMLVKFKDSSDSFTIDYESALITPAGVVHDDRGISDIYDTFALLPNKELVDSLLIKNDINKDQFYKKVGKSILIKRSHRLQEVLHHYFVEKFLLQNENENTLYLESRIISEAFSILFKEKSTMQDIAEFSYEESITKRAIKYIESNLFSSIDTKTLTNKALTSKSTLFRVFKKDTGRSPYNYIKSRRLEEAKKLLEKGQYNVSEIAILVGYNNFGAFSEAFKLKWGHSPTYYKARNIH